MDRLHTIKIKWSYPHYWSDYMNIDGIDDPNGGIYYITSVIHYESGDVEKPIYVGETKNAFYIRFRQHERTHSAWMDKNGEFRVRIGRIISPKQLPPAWCDNYKHLLRVAESAIIQSLLRMPNALNRRLANKSQMKTYSWWYNLHIINTGYHDILEQNIYNKVDLP